MLTLMAWAALICFIDWFLNLWLLCHYLNSALVLFTLFIRWPHIFDPCAFALQTLLFLMLIFKPYLVLVTEFTILAVPGPSMLGLSETITLLHLKWPSLVFATWLYDNCYSQPCGVLCVLMLLYIHFSRGKVCRWLVAT